MLRSVSELKAFKGGSLRLSRVVPVPCIRDAQVSNFFVVSCMG
jgi:hypothetical protein